MKTKSFLLTTLIMLFFSGTHLFATDGYFALGYGAKYKGVAGAGISLHHFSLIGGNPAGNVFLGNQYSVNMALFMPSRQFTVEGQPSGIPGLFGLAPGTFESDSKAFPIPSFGVNWMINENSALGVALYGNGGMNTNYPYQIFGDASIGATGVNLAQLFGEFTYSYRLSDKHGIGISAIVAYQYFKAEGLSFFGNFSSNSTQISNNGTSNSFGYGFKVGYMGELMDNLHLGGQFQSKVYMSEFDEYAGLFAEQGDFDVPMSWTAGIAYGASDKLTFMFDVKQIYYSDVAAVGNSMDLMNNPPAFPDGTPNPNFQPLGSASGWGFGWEDMTIYKFGLEFASSRDWTWRAGFSTGQQPIPESEVLFNILAPGVVENHLAVGFSKYLVSGNSLDFAFNYAFNKKLSGVNPLDYDPVQLMQGNFVPNQNITLEMNQIEISLGYSF